jgi:hypothetical protein
MRRTVEFNALPRDVRERLVRSINDSEPPHPIVSAQVEPKAKLEPGTRNFLLLVAGIAIAWVLLQTSILDVGYMVVHVPAFAVLFAVVALMLQGAAEKKRLPYERGRYLFPTDFVDATGAELAIIPTTQIADVECTHIQGDWGYLVSILVVHFQGGADDQAFLVGDMQEAEGQVQRILEARANTQDATDRNDRGYFIDNDLFYEMGRPNAAQGGHPYRGEAWDDKVQPNLTGPRVRPIPVYLNTLLVTVLGAAIGAGAFFYKRHSNDEAKWSHATNVDSVYSYDSYLAQGGTNHAGEATARMHEAALRMAKEDGSVTALRSFLREYPKADDEVIAEANQAVTALYARTLEDFRARASQNNPAAVAFVERLVKYLETNATAEVAVIFGSPTTDTLALVDSMLQEEANKIGNGLQTVAPISGHFDEGRSTLRHDAIVTNLGEGFRQVFPTDILSLTQTPRNKDKAPRIDIGYDVSWSGSMYGDAESNRVYVGITVHFTVKMTIPGDEQPLEFDLRVVPPQQFTVSYTSYSAMGSLYDSISDLPDDQVYGTMALRAFDQLAGKLSGTFFQGDTATANVLLNPPGDGVSGTYKIKDGRYPNGKRYKGTVEIVGITDRIYQVTFIDGRQQLMGVGIWDPPNLMVGWGTQSYFVGVCNHRNEMLRLDCQWTSSESMGEFGSEFATREDVFDADVPYVDKLWTLTGVNPGGVGEYAGMLSITEMKRSKANDIQWSIDATSFNGIGVDVGDHFVVAWGTDYQLTNYVLGADGALDGTFYQPGVAKPGTERLVRN